VDDYYETLSLPFLGKDRADREYPMKSFIEEGVLMASASDFPVTIPFDPLIGIETGITRMAIGGSDKNILWSEESVSLEEMIASFTINGAIANFLEEEIGSLEVEKKADFIVIDQNLFQIPTIEIAKTKVLRTFVDGKEVFNAAGE
jgi:predicted amidohydrolase YtcJ